MSNTAQSAVTAGQVGEPMTHRQVLEAMSGLLLALFVAMLSATVVSNALPRIVADLRGTESGYTWIVTATLLTTTASTPIWGKLADLFSKKLLVQLALLIFALGSCLAGLAQSMGWLIAARAVQGVGAGGLTALVQVVIASIVSPRERGRYSGYLGATFAIATVSGPLLGGLIVDTPWLGWRWCFYVGLPVAALAFVVLQKTLHLPVIRRENATIDYLGAALITGGVSVLLIWVSLVGTHFDWMSTTSLSLVGGGVLLLVAAVVNELKVREPIIPMRLFRDRTTSLATIASVMVGVAMFGSTVFLSQYFQIARGMSPTNAGLMTVCLVGGLFVSSLGVGRVISKTGVWKRYLVSGMVLVTAGLFLLSTINARTDLVVIGLYMVVLGVGMGATMQNLVLAVQNNTAQADMGAASATVAFFRTMGGAIGVSALGAALSHGVTDRVVSGLQRLGVQLPANGDVSSSSVPNLSAMPTPVRLVFETAFGNATAHIFLLAVPFTVLALLAVLLIREVPLRTTIEREDELEKLAAEAGAEVRVS